LNVNKLTRSVEKMRERNPFFNWNLGGVLDGDDLFVPIRHLTSAIDHSFTPNINVIEKKSKLVVEAELPGMAKEDVSIFVEGDFLVLTGERQEETENEEDGVLRKESRYGAFRRAVPIGPGSDPSKIKAKFKNGMVRIEMPKPKERRKERAEIPIM